jgi:hypothetical protein
MEQMDMKQKTLRKMKGFELNTKALSSSRKYICRIWHLD